MEVVLKRISKDAWDELMQSVTSEFERTQKIAIDDVAVENAAEIVCINGEAIKIDIDVEKYKKIANTDAFIYEKRTDLGMLLCNDLKMKDGQALPYNILNEKEVWAYLSLTVFKDVVKALSLADEEKISVDKIRRFYFNKYTTQSNKSRIGLLFVWNMVATLDTNDRNFILTAFKFIDPVKAIYERAMGKNKIIVKAFVQGIINNNCDKRLRNDRYRSRIPSHISCYSCVNILDVYSYDELVENITEQIKTILNI